MERGGKVKKGEGNNTGGCTREERGVWEDREGSEEEVNVDKGGFN